METSGTIFFQVKIVKIETITLSDLKSKPSLFHMKTKNDGEIMIISHQVNCCGGNYSCKSLNKSLTSAPIMLT